MKHLQTIWLIMAQFKAFTRGRLHPTLPLAGKRLWSSHSGKAQLSKKGKPDYMTQHQNGGQIQISGECCSKPFYQYYYVCISFEQMHAWIFDSFYFTATHSHPTHHSKGSIWFSFFSIVISFVIHLRYSFKTLYI